jgi:hypothetical protein
VRPIFDDAANYDSAVARTAERFIVKYGKVADSEAWKAARMPNLTRSERNYCETVARLVSRHLGATSTV